MIHSEISSSLLGLKYKEWEVVRKKTREVRESLAHAASL